MNLSSLYNNSYTHTFFITFFIYLQRTAEEQKSFSSASTKYDGRSDASSKEIEILSLHCEVASLESKLANIVQSSLSALD